MNKSFLKKVVQASFVNGVLDEANVSRITKSLSYSELKNYTTLLKRELAKLSVVVVSATSLTSEQQVETKTLYPGKSVSFKTDSTLLGGVRVIENDMIYENNIATTLHRLESHVIQV